MSRETKVGLIVAASFLLLVGSVVTYKLYLVPPPADDTPAEGATQADGPPKKPAPGNTPEQPATNGPGSLATNTPSSGKEPPSEGSSAINPPPAETPLLANSKDNRPPLLPPADESGTAPSGRPGVPGERAGAPPVPEKPGLSLAGNAGAASGLDARLASDTPPAGGGAPPPPETPDVFRDNRPGAATPPPPATPDVVKDFRPAGSDARSLPDSRFPPPPDAPPVIMDRGGRPGLEEKKPVHPPMDVPPPETPLTKESPRDVGRMAGRPGFETQPRPAGTPRDEAKAGTPEPPLSLPPEARMPPNPRGNDAPPPPEAPTPGMRPPVGGLPPANNFDRRYDTPPQIGKPMMDPIASADDSKRGVPVEIRPQPEIDNSPAPAGVRGSGNVVVFDEARYPVRTGDTYASISKLKYGHERYAEALALYNRERDPRMTLPQPGQVVVIPPAEILEKRYRAAVTNGSAAPVESTPVSRPDARREAPVAYNAGDGRPMAPPGSVAPRPSFNAKEKTYRVRTGDTLWNIAKQTLGNGERWAEILRLNRDVLPEINRLQDGLILRLPADAKVDMSGNSP